MKQTTDHSEPIESYHDYKTGVFTRSVMTVDAVLDNVAAGSLRPEDKKKLLVVMMQSIQFEILTKF